MAALYLLIAVLIIGLVAMVCSTIIKAAERL